MTDEQAGTNRWITIAIVAGLIAWGILHTVGVYLSSDDPRRALVKAGIVAACMLGFLGFWGFLLRQRSRRSEDERD